MPASGVAQGRTGGTDGARIESHFTAGGTETTESQPAASDPSSAPRPTPDVAPAPPQPPAAGPRRVQATVGAHKQAQPTHDVRGTRVSATALVASGVSVSQGAEHPNANRSPVMLTMDLGFSHPEVRWLEIGPGMLLEMERGVAFGLALRARAFLPLRRVRPYALAAIPAMLAPTTLFGAQFGGGVSVELHRYFSLAAEVAPTIFFWGADLPGGGTVTKFDGAAGLRVTF